MFSINDWIGLDWTVVQIVHIVDKCGLWHRLPVLLGLAYLGLRRRLHQRYNLLHVGTNTGKQYDVQQYPHRTADGKCNHPTDHIVGSQGTFFGRNMPPSTSNFGVRFRIHQDCNINFFFFLFFGILYTHRCVYNRYMGRINKFIYVYTNK
ncbi:putative hem peroxidase superfamily [Helianthus anomalus]